MDPSSRGIEALDLRTATPGVGLVAARGVWVDAAVAVLDLFGAPHQCSRLGHAAIVPDVGAVGEARAARGVDAFKQAAGAVADRFARTLCRVATCAARPRRVAASATEGREHRTQHDGVQSIMLLHDARSSAAVKDGA